MSRIINIDALRGVSVLMIVMLHISALSDIPKSNISSILIQFMSYGVPFFFVISGFVISLTSQNLFNGQTLNNFFIKRALKIIPLYLLFLFFWLFIFYIFNEINIQLPRNSPNKSNVSFLNFLIHIFFLQGFFPSSLNTLLDGDWSIVNEVYFYILFPLLHLYAKSSLEKLTKLLFLSLCASVIFSLFNYVLKIGHEYSYYGFLNHLPFFIFGMIGFNLSNNDMVNKYISQNRLMLLLVVFVLSIGSISLEGKIFGPEYIFSFLFLLAMLLLRSSKKISSFKLTIFLAYIGQQSYAIYFTHLLLIKITVSLYPMIEMILPLSLLQANIISGIFLTLFCSHFIFHKIDNYFVKKFKM